MASQLTSPYGGGGSGFDQALAGILQGQDIDQARGQDAMAQQQRQQLAQQELAQRQRELALGALLSQQGQSQEMQMEQMRQQGRMAEQQSQQDFLAQQASVERAYLEGQAKKAAQAQAIVQQAEEEVMVAQAEKNEQRIAEATAKLNEANNALGDAAFRVSFMTAARGKTEEQVGSILANLSQKVEEFKQTQMNAARTAGEVGLTVYDDIVTEGKKKSADLAKVFSAGRAASAFAQGGTVQGVMDFLFGANVQVSDAEIAGLQYLQLQPTGIPVGGLSPYQETSASLVGGVDSPETIRQKVVDETAKSIVMSLARMPNTKVTDIDLARKAVIRILSSTEQDPSALQELSAAGVDPFMLKTMFSTIANKASESKRAAVNRISQLGVSGGGQESLQTKALGALVIAEDQRSGMLAGASSRMSVTTPEVMTGFLATLNNARTSGGLKGMLGFGGAARDAGLSDTYGQLEAAIGRPVFGPQAGASMMGLGQMRAGDLYSDQAISGALVEKDLAGRRVEGLQAEQGLLPLQLQTGNVRAQAAARQKAREELRRKGLEGYMDLIGGQS
jgi:hypothetical protein